jgi:hypothetical protein
MRSLPLILCLLFAARFVGASSAKEPQVTLQDFKLVGDLTKESATFTLTATARMENPRGGSFDLLSGQIALTAIELDPKVHMRVDGDHFVLAFDRRGEFPIRVQFSAAITQADGWSAVGFRVAPGVLQSVMLRGLAADSQFKFPGAARLDRQGADFASYLPADGAVYLSWKEARRETGGKLFFFTEMLAQISVSPGLMRQVALLNFKVMQGELTRVSARLRGAGEITRVQGDQVLAWNIEPVADSEDRRLVIQLNQPQKDQFSVQVQAQSSLGAFPQTADALRLIPEKTTGFSGSVRIVNEGAVRLEVTGAGGMSQISPEQFPESDATRAAFRAGGNQCFAFHFAGADYALRIQADQILPELSASELLAYRYGENELAIDAEIELDIREAPLRELLLRVPKGYAVARLNAPSLSDSDYSLSGAGDGLQAELRLTFGQPLSGRQLVQIRLERNQGLGETNWTLPRIDIAKASTVHGFVGLTSDPGFRLTTERTEALTEIAPAFYPGTLSGIQAAFRVTEAAWSATARVERLPQTVQADALHLFSIGEGIAYGSSIINYIVSGAPVSSFRIELANEYANVEFTGKDIRSWQTNNGGYIVQLHTPVSGAYTLLATYERPFKAHGETLSFTGARPLDCQSEQGYTLVTSDYQFQVTPAEISTGLLPLETGEVPHEYRLFSDAPVLAAYRYAARPFNLKLTLSPLAQEDSLNQIVDRASLETRISKEGQAVTAIRYFIKNRGAPHFRLTIPTGAQLWSATVNGVEAVPVSDGAASLIPLPQNADPNAVLELDLKMAAAASDPRHVRVEAPVTDPPVMLAEWKLEPDTGQRLIYQDGSIMPAVGITDVSGFAQLARLLSHKGWEQSMAHLPAAITLLAPVQQSGSALRVAVLNVADKTTAFTVLGWIWPGLLGLAVWICGLTTRGRLFQFAGQVCGWTFLAWAALRIPNGAGIFFYVVLAFVLLHAGVPAWHRIRRWSRVPVPAAATLIMASLLCFGGAARGRAAEAPAMPDSVSQTVRVEDKFVLGDAKIHWQAVKGQSLPLLSSNAVLTSTTYLLKAFDLVPAAGAQRLVARKSGAFDIEVRYETRVSTDQGESGFTLPTPCGLIHRLELTVVNLDVDIESPQAVSVQCDHATTNSVANVVLTPAQARINWRPRSRDVTKEKAVFYAEVSPLYIPSAGVIEGMHYVSIRPAQGEVDELLVRVPMGQTITDVADPVGRGSVVSLWRFDPDTRRLRITLNPPQSRPFVVVVRSQAATDPLPLKKTLGLMVVDKAVSQIGLAGIATGGDVQLDAVSAPSFSSINLEDFPGDAVAALQGEIPGLTLRRAFRYTNTQAVITINASSVQPDVRIQTDDTLSLGEDHTVLADNFTAEITRAGIFDLSFLMPPGFDVESIGGAALSQWTESKTATGRIITLHLPGKTQGAQSFAITLSGPGVKNARGWATPQIVLREATKQQRTLLVVPEQGMRLQIAAREGYTQLDPQKSGIRQKGVLAFRALQVPARLTLDIDQVDPWVQVNGWQNVAINEAEEKTTANLQYQIENTGLKSFRLFLPVEAEGVDFHGDQVGDFLPTPGAVTNQMQAWEVKLRRRVIGPFLLQVVYQTPLPARATQTVLRGIQALDVNSQRGFLTVQSDPRLEVTVDSTPPALQPAEWQSIPRELQKDSPSAASLTYRLIEPSFQLSLKLARHEVAKLLPAHVNNITFNSVVSDDGVMLTQARLEIIPGDKRLLSVALPPDARFWFAFVNDNGVWPWHDSANVLIPLEQQVGGDKPATVEIYYGCQAGTTLGRELDLNMAAPKFDLPLENITWRISLSDKWHIQHYAGALQFQKQEESPGEAVASPQYYLDSEKTRRQARAQEAQDFMALGNSSLEKGDPQQARRAFQSAFGLSTDDAAFNEDARVQLHKIKLQEALIGFDARQSGAAGALGAKLRALCDRQDLNYTQQDAKDIIDINSAEDNAAFMRLSEKLIQQQDAAVSIPAAIRASIPQQGQMLTFHRAVAVNEWADLRIALQATMVRTASGGIRLLILLGAGVFFSVFGAAFSRMTSRT